MPTVTHTFTFDTNLEAWTSVTGFSFNVGDGQPNPGCMRVVGIAPASGNCLRTAFHDIGWTYEDFGVPAGKLVTDVALSMQGKRVDTNGTVSTLVAFLLIASGVSNIGTFGNFNLLTAPEDTWTEYTDTIEVIESFGNSDRVLTLQLTLQSTGSASHDWQERLDTIELTFTYEDIAPECDLGLSPTTASLEVNASTTFTANQVVDWAITEVGGGTLSSSSGASTNYTAPATPGTYHVTATDPDDGTCIETATITVTDTASEEGLEPQHLLRYRPGTQSVVDARTVPVMGGSVFTVEDPSSETAIDGVCALVATVFEGDAKISGAQLGKYLYLQADTQGETMQRMKPDYTLEALAPIPKGATPTAALSTLTVQKFTDTAVFDPETNIGGGADATVATDYVEVTGPDGAGIQYPYDTAQNWSAMNWVMVIVSPPTQSDGGGTVIISVATAAGNFEKIGEIYDTPGGLSPVVVFCPLSGLSAATRAAVKRIRMVRNGGTAAFLVHGVLPIPSAPQAGPVEYFITFQKASTLAESVPTEKVTVTFDSSAVVIPVFHSVRRHYSTYADEGFLSANPDTLPPAVMYNKSAPAAYPSSSEFAGIPTFSGTAPAGDFDTIRLWRITENGTRLVKSQAVTPEAAYTITDDSGTFGLSKALYKATGTPPPCMAMAAVGGRLIVGGDPANPQRIVVSNFLPFAQDIDPFPQFPALPVEQSDGHSFDIAPSAAEQVLWLGEGDGALYIGTNYALYVMTDLSPFPPIGSGSVPFKVWERGVISRRGAVWAEDRLWWAAHDGVYTARNRADVEELTAENKTIYRTWLLPDENTVVGYQDRKLVIIRGTRYMRLDLVTGRWTRGTLAHIFRHPAAWRDPTGIIQHLWFLDTGGFVNRWQPGTEPGDANRATSDAGVAIADWTYETGYAVTPVPARVNMAYLDATGEVELSVYKDSSVFRSKTFATGEKELSLASDLRAYKFRVKFEAGNLVSVRRAMWERGEIKGAKGGGTAA